MDSDLFSFLDEGPAGVVDDDEMEGKPVGVNGEPPISRKRKNSESEMRTTPPLLPEDGKMQTADDEPGLPLPKRARIMPLTPVVVDEFETEAKREVAASAGLTGGVEPGVKLELRHQARHSSDGSSCYL
jgi:ATP-dependent RNA helicase DOB1